MPGLIRVILIAIVFGILFSIYRKFKKKLLVHKNSQKNSEAQQGNNSPTKMLRCEQCGVFVPESDVIKEGEHVYCSLEHKDNK